MDKNLKDFTLEEICTALKNNPKFTGTDVRHLVVAYKDEMEKNLIFKITFEEQQYPGGEMGKDMCLPVNETSDL